MKNENLITSTVNNETVIVDETWDLQFFIQGKNALGCDGHPLGIYISDGTYATPCGNKCHGECDICEVVIRALNS